MYENSAPATRKACIGFKLYLLITDSLGNYSAKYKGKDFSGFDIKFVALEIDMSCVL